MSEDFATYSLKADGLIHVIQVKKVKKPEPNPNPDPSQPTVLLVVGAGLARMRRPAS